jgi:hypothetical protein
MNLAPAVPQGPPSRRLLPLGHRTTLISGGRIELPLESWRASLCGRLAWCHPRVMGWQPQRWSEPWRFVRQSTPLPPSTCLEMRAAITNPLSHAYQRPKLERYDKTLFLVLKTVNYIPHESISLDREIVETGEIMVFTASDFVITVRHGEFSGLAGLRGTTAGRCRPSCARAVCRDASPFLSVPSFHRARTSHSAGRAVGHR